MFTSLLCTALLAAAGASPEQPATKPAANPGVRERMAGLASGLRGLLPYLSADGAFSDAANSTVVRGWLETLATNADGVGHTDRAKGAGFAVSAKVLETQVARSLMAFDVGHKDESKWLVRQTMRACIACHTQEGVASGAPLIDVPAMPGDRLGRGDLLLVTRQFDAALALYRQYLSEFAWKPREPTLNKKIGYGVALDRYLLVQLRGTPDLKTISADLTAWRDRPGVPADVLANLSAATKALASKDLLPPFVPEKADDATLLAWAGKRCDVPLGSKKTTFDPLQTVPTIIATNVMYQYLDRARNSPSVPRALVLVARCEAQLGRNYLVPMSDLYLEECVRRVPHSDQARACMKELEAYLDKDDAGREVPWNTGRYQSLRELAGPKGRAAKPAKK